ncbi:MAG: hypothetical protein RL662_109 [Bacteroidota bacterium]|jgi:hypothetical protein
MEYIKNNAILYCSCELLPTLLNVTSNSKIRNRGGFFATEKDNIGGVNVVTFGLCAMMGVCFIPGVKLNWINPVNKVKVLGYRTLLDKQSKLICPKGGVISCLMSGQFF